MSCLFDKIYKREIENEFKKFKRRDSKYEFCKLFYPQKIDDILTHDLHIHYLLSSYFLICKIASFLNSEKLYLDYKNSTTLNRFLKKIPPSEEKIFISYLQYKREKNKFR